jgi:diguanylate cyclase (GGDEF)-like protein
VHGEPSNDAGSKEKLKAEIASAYRPIIRGFMLPAALFYGIVIIPNFFLSEFSTALALSAPALLTVMAAIGGLIYLSRREATYHELEIFGALMAMLIFINCCNLIYLDYNPLNLVYFLILFTVAVAVAVSVRVVFAISALSMVTTLTIAYRMGPDVMSHVVFGVLAAAFASVGLSVLTRGAIMKAIKSKLLAEGLQKRAEIQADYDALTGMPNRRHFFSAIETIIEDATPDVTIGIIDLDGFKSVNDLYGHAVGDELLVEVSKRLRNACPSTNPMARLGGDEFAVAIRRKLDDNQLRQFGQALIDALREPFTISNIQIAISASIGFAHHASGQTLREVYERADHALYRAKRDAGGQVVIFLSEHEAELSDIGLYEQALRTADLAREIHVVFQPQHDLQKGVTTGFEALARWHSPSLGDVNPGQFIAAAERSGIMERLTGDVVQKSLAAALTWPADITISINLSGIDLISPRSIANIVQIVCESGIDPQRVMFEITETTIMSDFNCARRSLEKLAALGCRIALDDFGSGYSSFAYIHRFPLHRIKTDRCFVTMRKEDEALCHNILRSIADLCANLGVECLAEGIETARELSTVRKAGVRFIQGYHFGRPMSAADSLLHLEKDRPAQPAQAIAG